MSSNSNNFRQLNVTEKSSNLIQIAPANPCDMSHPTYHPKKKRCQCTEHLSRAEKIAWCSHVGGINFADPVNTRKAHEELINQVRHEAICISSKYKVHREPLQFEWDRFIHTLENEFPDILNEMLNCNSQQQPLNANENRSMPHKNIRLYNNFRRGPNTRTRILTTPSPTMTQSNMANMFHHFLHSMPETANMSDWNGHFTNHTYHTTQTRRTPTSHCTIQNNKHIKWTTRLLPWRITDIKYLALWHFSMWVLQSCLTQI